MHLILPYAASQRWPDAQAPWGALPGLQRLLARMCRVQVISDAAWERPHPLMPHERVLAQALGWPDAGPWPWAAHETGIAGPQAWITPCHWQVGMDQVVMLPPRALGLTEEESRQLMQAMQPYMAQDGLQLQWHSPLQWLAQGALLQHLTPASLERVSGRNIRPWITGGSLPRELVRLQSEMQMLLYNHPVNDARLARGQVIVNAFWLHGAGQLGASLAPPRIQCIQDLADSVQAEDLSSWQASWQRLDRELLAPLDRQQEGLTLTLCSENAAHTWRQVPMAWPSRWLRRLKPMDPSVALKALLDTSDIR